MNLNPVTLGAAAVAGQMGTALVSNLLGGDYDLDAVAERAVECGAGVALVAVGVDIVRGSL